MGYIYSWIPAYAEIVKRLHAFKNKQLDLIQVLRDVGVKVNEDEDRPGNKIPLTEIDPYTFLFFLGKHKNEWNKIKVLRSLCELWNINETVYDVCGIPSANAQKLWMFPWQYTRTNNEIGRLWDFFDKADKGTITDADFAGLRSIPGIEKQKITEALFIQNPQEYLCINSKMRPYLQAKGINVVFETYTQLQSLYQTIKNSLPIPYHQLSFESHINSVFGNHIPQFYRIGTKEGEKGVSVLPEMIENNIISIGWSEIGSLYEIDPLNKKHIQTTLQSVGYYSGDNRQASRKAGEILQFIQDIKPGDYVFAADGGTIKAIGKVISDHYAYDDSLTFPHIRCIKWIAQDVQDLYLDEGLRTSVWEYENQEILDKINQYLKVNLSQNEFNPYKGRTTMPLNTILYGPPGTGKTFQSINYAVAIIEDKSPEAVEKEDRATVKKRFDDYIKNRRIVFATFHQSMGYEDFIEGIKPKVDEDEGDEDQDQDMQLSYEIKDGVFKTLCTEAAFSFVKHNVTAETEKVLDFSEQYDRYIEILLDELSRKEYVEIPTKNGGKILVISITKHKNIKFKHQNGTRRYIVSKSRLNKLSQAYPDLNDITNIYDQIRDVIKGMNSTGYWAVLNALRKQPLVTAKDRLEQQKEYSYEDKKTAIESLKNEDYKTPNPKKFVLIIDEINRGNVSQIFGELITLIEDDKRAGEAESLTTVLPYSNDCFSVPPNLYVIGTMNTADRSIEALDTALRRRFSFFPILPEPNKLEIIEDEDSEIDLIKMLQSLNERLAILKDHDHTIGHAWLWNVTNLAQLKSVYSNKILPLLQEFFYNDYEKLGLVLGDAFFEPYTKVDQRIFANFNGGNGLADQYDGVLKYQLKSADKLTFEDFQSLYKYII